MVFSISYYSVNSKFLILGHLFSVGPPFEFFFRVKFYVSDPSKLAEEYTRYAVMLSVHGVPSHKL